MAQSIDKKKLLARILLVEDNDGDPRPEPDVSHRADRYIYKPPVLEQFIEEVGKAVEELLLLGTDRKRVSGAG